MFLARLERPIIPHYLCTFCDRPAGEGLEGLLAFLVPPLKAREDLWVRHLPRRSRRPRLLDVGCGNGDFLARMQSLGWDAQGIDLDGNAVASARASNLRVQQGTLDDVEFPETYFDAITLSHSIEHMHAPLSAIETCYRILPQAASCGW